MCQFFSGIALENGDVITSEYTDSHELLMLANGIHDGHAQRGRFARLELLPPDDQARVLDSEAWALAIDGKDEPEWWAERKADVERQMRARLERMIVRESRDILLGGCWVVGGNARIGQLAAGRIVVLCGSAIVERVCGSAIVERACDSAIVEHVHGSARVECATDSVYVKNVSGTAVVELVTGSAHVESVCGSARVGIVDESARIEYVQDSAHVYSVYGSAIVERVHDSADVGRVYESARVEIVRDSARVGSVYDSARVGSLCGSARVGVVAGSSIVEHVYDSARVGILCDSAIVERWSTTADPPRGWTVREGLLVRVVGGGIEVSR